jgi:hypothetical protein
MGRPTNYDASGVQMSNTLEDFLMNYTKRYSMSTPTMEVPLSTGFQKMVVGPKEITLTMSMDAILDLAHADIMYRKQQKEAEHRKAIPAAQKAWDHYQMIMKLTQENK